MKIFNDKGMSLVQVMLASAISIGVAMGIMRMNKTSQKTMRKVMSDSDLISFKANLQSRLGETAVCETALQGIDIRTGYDNKKDIQNRFATVGGGASFTVGEMLQSAPSFNVLETMVSEFTPSLPGNVVGGCELRITLERNNQKNSYGGKHIAVKVPLTCEVDSVSGAARTIKSCYSSFSGGGGAGSSVWEAQNDADGSYIAFLGIAGNPRALIGSNASFAPVGVKGALNIVTPPLGQTWTPTVNAPSTPAQGIGLVLGDTTAMVFGKNLEIGLWNEGDNVLKTNKNFEAADTIIAQNEMSAPRHWAFNYFFLSDERFKKDVRPIENALDTITRLNGVSYYMRKAEYPQMNFSDKKQLGVIAQNVEKVLPEVVSQGKNDYKSVEYSQLIPVLIESVKELKAEVEALKAKNKELESRLK